jgi:plastocyanin domain-containing protein
MQKILFIFLVALLSFSLLSPVYSDTEVKDIFAEKRAIQVATLHGDVQEVRFDLEPFFYPDLVIQRDIPLIWIINVDERNLNHCNNEIIIPALSITKKLEIGENVIEFTPGEVGVIEYSCWMNMITSTIVIVDDIA